jgi:hypothetical protein
VRTAPARSAARSGCRAGSGRARCRRSSADGSDTTSASMRTSPSRARDSTAAESSSASGRSAATTRRSVCARRWRNEPSKRDCLRSGS